mgnify:CR=1 FL=1
MENGGTRIILLGRDLELRIISLIVRARELSQEVIFFDLGSNDLSVELAEEFNCKVFHYGRELGCKDISKYILDQNLDLELNNLVLRVTDDWKLSDFPVIENRVRESWDIYIAFSREGSKDLEDADQIIITHVYDARNQRDFFRGYWETNDNSLIGMIHFDPSSNKPKYQQLIDQLKIKSHHKILQLQDFFLGIIFD